jgi:hypothetical protein
VRRHRREVRLLALVLGLLLGLLLPGARA